MPIYTYKCESCGSNVEHVTPIAKYKPMKKCPDCGAHNLVRTYDGYGGFHLKGRDWPSRDIKRTGR